MNILSNEQVQAAMIALIVVGLNALAQWVRGKVSHTKIVDEYWCYIQPVAEIVRKEAAQALASSTASNSVLQSIVQKGLATWADSFRLNENKDPTVTQIAAVSGELECVVERAINGSGK
jgi:hypothetical protein